MILKKWIEFFYRILTRILGVILEIQLKDKNITVNNGSYNYFFVVFDPTSQLNILIEDYYEYYNQVMNRDANNAHIEDIYDRKKYVEFVNLLPEDQKRSYLFLTFNTDGSPVFKS